MSVRDYLRARLEAILARRNFRRVGWNQEIADSRILYDWQRTALKKPAYRESELPAAARDVLRSDHPRLAELRARYAAVDPAVTRPLLWTEDHVRDEDIRYFRGDNAYVWQLRGMNMNPISYALTTYYAQSIDRRGLLDSLVEDDLFGNFTFRAAGRVVSRDLLDSILEIDFLEQRLRISEWSGVNILDIGAGYGRLAHRMASALPRLGTYLCTDAVPVSTFLSEFYVRFRQVDSKVRVVPLDEIERTMENSRVDLAVNVHSFSECSVDAIAWWLSLLARHAVRYLMIVPNWMGPSVSDLRAQDGQGFGDLIERAGYRLLSREPKYRDPIVQEYGVDPTFHYLFELKPA